MIHSGVGPLPHHQYVRVSAPFVHTDGEAGDWLHAVWFGLVSYPSRMWGCTVMLESGAIYRNLPLHTLAHEEPLNDLWGPEQAQYWDCYGTDFATLVYPYLEGLDCLARVGRGALEQEFHGRYVFTAVPLGDGYSAAPEQAKEFTFVALDNGRFTVQPTDRVVFRDLSFTQAALEYPTGIRRQREIWRCE